MDVVFCLVQASLSATFAIIFFRALFKSKLDRRVFVFLWTVIVFCLFLSPVVTPLINTSKVWVDSNDILPVAEVLPNTGEIIEKIEQLSIQAGLIENNLMPDTQQEIPVLFTIWLVGVTVLLTSIALLYALFYRQCQKALLVSNIGYEEYLNGSKVYLNDQISSPVTIGFFSLKFIYRLDLT